MRGFHRQPTQMAIKDMPKHGFIQSHAERIRDELREVGATFVDLLLPETRSLPFIIHTDEHIRGAVYGRSKDGIGILVATDRRIIFLDKKLLFMKFDEITYDVVSGISMGFAGLFGTLTLHTRIGDFTLKTLNQKCASNFVEYIETARLDRLIEQENA